LLFSDFSPVSGRADRFKVEDRKDAAAKTQKAAARIQDSALPLAKLNLSL
jgi:hypothetical protein